MQNSNSVDISDTFGVNKLDHYILLENVDFLNCWYGIHSYSLQGALKSFVIRCGGLVNSLLLSANMSIIHDNRHEKLLYSIIVNQSKFKKKKKKDTLNICSLFHKKNWFVKFRLHLDGSI